jgi:hypothetical protein
LRLSFRDGAFAPDPESRDSGFDASHRPGMTESGYDPALSRREAPEFCTNHLPRKQRAQGMPGARRARSLACKIKKHTSIITTVTPDSPGIPCAMGYDLFRALPGDRAFLPPSLTRKIPANLTPASGRQDHTTSPSATRAARLRRCHVHALMTLRNAPLLGRDGVSRRFDLPDGEREIFLQMGLDSRIHQGRADLPVGQISRLYK